MRVALPSCSWPCRFPSPAKPPRPRRSPSRASSWTRRALPWPGRAHAVEVRYRGAEPGSPFSIESEGGQLSFVAQEDFIPVPEPTARLLGACAMRRPRGPRFRARAYRYSQFAGYVFDSTPPAPQGTVPLCLWYSPSRGDNSTCGSIATRTWTSTAHPTRFGWPVTLRRAGRSAPTTATTWIRCRIPVRQNVRMPPTMIATGRWTNSAERGTRCGRA